MGIDPGYFLDMMSFEAVALAWEAYQKSCRESWEQTRDIAYQVARPWLKDKPTKEQFMPFKWDQPEEKDIIQPDRERFDELTTLLNLN